MDLLSKSLGLDPLNRAELYHISREMVDILSTSTVNNDQRSVLNGFYGHKHSEKTKLLLSDKAKNNKRRLGKKHTEETKDKIRQKKIGQPSARKGMPAWNKGLTQSPETTRKISEALRGVARSAEAKEAIRLAAKNRMKKTCPHCNKIVDASNYSRWHGDMCKHA